MLTLALLIGARALAEEKVQFPSLDAPTTSLDGYLFRPASPGRRPAIVFMHGCGGLLTASGKLMSRERDWAIRLNRLGYAVLMVDSFTPRGSGQMCAPSTFRESIHLARPKDAYGALRYLQEQSFIRVDRIGLMGWSQGGGALLFAIRAESLGRPRDLASPDFRAAIAFYPAACSDRAHKAPWTSTIPLLVLIGERDVWTPAAPCQQLVEGAKGRGSPAEIRIYPGAWHDFDWPNLPVRELPNYRTSAGVVPVTGTDPAARADVLRRVPDFLARHLGP